MKRAFLIAGLPFASVLVAAFAAPHDARADEPAPSATAAPAAARATWGVRPADATSTARHDAPVVRARELLLRARYLDDAAAVDEKAAADLATKLPAMRLEAKAARDRADRAATPEQRDTLGARAEDLETDVTISEAEIPFKKKTAIENRRVAHELRVRATKLVREEPAASATTPLYDPTAPSCDPPFRYTADGRKVYRLECLEH